MNIMNIMNHFYPVNPNVVMNLILEFIELSI